MLREDSTDATAAAATISPNGNEVCDDHDEFHRPDQSLLQPSESVSGVSSGVVPTAAALVRQASMKLVKVPSAAKALLVSGSNATKESSTPPSTSNNKNNNNNNDITSMDSVELSINVITEPVSESSIAMTPTHQELLPPSTTAAAGSVNDSVTTTGKTGTKRYGLLPWLKYHVHEPKQAHNPISTHHGTLFWNHIEFSKLHWHRKKAKEAIQKQQLKDSESISRHHHHHHHHHHLLHHHWGHLLQDHHDAPGMVVRIIVLVCLFLQVCGPAMGYACVGALGLKIKQQYGIGDDKLGLLFSVYSFPNIVAVLVAGILIDKVGENVMCLICTLLFVGGNVITIGNNYICLLVGRVLYGVGSECIGIVNSSLVARWFAHDNKITLALANAICLVSFRFSAFLVMFAIPPLGDAIGLQGTLAVLTGIVGVSGIANMLILGFDRRYNDYIHHQHLVLAQVQQAVAAAAAAAAAATGTTSTDDTSAIVDMSTITPTASPSSSSSSPSSSADSHYSSLAASASASTIATITPSDSLDQLTDDAAAAAAVAVAASPRASVDDTLLQSCTTGTGTGTDASAITVTPSDVISRITTTITTAATSATTGNNNKKKRQRRLRNQKLINLLSVLKLPLIFWIIATVGVIYYGAVLTFISFGNEFISQKWGMSAVTSSFVTSSVYFAATAVLVPVGFIIDRFGHRLSVIVLGLALTIVGYVLLIFTRLTPWVGCIILGSTYGFIPAAIWPTVPLVVDDHHTGTAFGLFACLINFALFIVPFAVGYIPNFYNKGIACFVLAIVGLLGSIVLWLFDRIKFKAKLEFTCVKKEHHE